MEKDLVQGGIGSVGKYDVAFKEKQLVIEIDASVAVGSAGMVIKLDAGKVLDAIAAAVPGKLDDALIGIIKSALLGE